MASVEESSVNEVAVPAKKEKQNSFFWWTRPGTSQEEIKFVRKLDLCLLTYCSLSFFCKDLDRNNITNAYVSGMKEDLNLNGNELNWFTTYYQIGYIIGQIPSNILLTKISPRYYLPGAEFVWSFLVLFLYKVQSAEQTYVLRFFIGMVEATCWPGLHFMVGSWYRNHEVGKRTGIFEAAGIVATMFSGYIQSGVYTSLNGALGIAGWRWLFIIDFIISLPLLGFGFAFIPNPITSKVKTWWMTVPEKELAIRRLAEDNRQPLGKLDLTVFKRVFCRWPFWVMNIAFSLLYFVYQAPSTTTMELWMKAEGTYTVPQINNYPTVYSAVSIVYMVGSGIYNDYAGNHLASLLLIGFCCIISESILIAWFVPTGAKYFAFWIFGVIQASLPIIVSWTHQVCSGDAEERAIVVGSLNSIGVAQGTWWNQVFVKTTSAPRFKIGYEAGLAAAIAMTAWFPIMELFDRKHKRKEELGRVTEADGGSENTSTRDEIATGGKEANTFDEKSTAI